MYKKRGRQSIMSVTDCCRHHLSVWPPRRRRRRELERSSMFACYIYFVRLIDAHSRPRSGHPNMLSPPLLSLHSTIPSHYPSPHLPPFARTEALCYAMRVSSTRSHSRPLVVLEREHTRSPPLRTESTSESRINYNNISAPWTSHNCCQLVCAEARKCKRVRM